MYIQTEHCVPPGNERNPATGNLLLQLSNIIIIKSLVPQSLSFKITMWGSKTPQLFVPVSKERFTATYTIRCSHTLLMKYLSDMETLLIQAVDKRNTKRIGTMIVNIKRFQTLNSYGQPVVSEFQEKFEIYGASKVKIGQATLAMEFTETIPPPPAIETAHFIQQVVFREEPQKPYQPGTGQPKNIISQNTQTNHFSEPKVIPDRPTVVIRNPSEQRETVKRNRHQQTDYVEPLPLSPSKDKLNYSVNLQLQKLKDDQALLFGHSTEQQQNLSDGQLNVQIVAVRYFNKPSRPLEKLTVVYPQRSKNQSIPITSILVPVTTSSNYYEFQQSITMKTSRRGEDQEVIFYCGDFSGAFPLSKFINSGGVELKLLLKKKDGSKGCEIICKSTLKTQKIDYSLLMYIGDYKFGLPGDYFLVIKSKIHQAKVITPINPKTFHVKLIFPLVNLPEVFVVEARRRGQEGQKIEGIIVLKIDIGGSDSRVEVKSVQGLAVGWLRLITRVDSSSQISLFSERLEEQIKAVKFPVQQQRLPNPPAPQPSPAPQPIQPPIEPNIPKPQPQAPKPQPKQTFYETFPEMYIKIFESIRLCTNPRCKALTDKFVSKEDISQEEFFSLLQLACPSLSDQQLRYFTRHFDYPLRFQTFSQSYRKYVQYESKIRSKLKQQINQLQKRTNQEAIKQKFKNLPRCFGYLDCEKFVDNLAELSGIKDLSLNLAKYLYFDKRKQIHLDTFYALLEQDVESLKDISTFVYSQIILKELIGLHHADDIQQQLQKFLEDNNYLNIMTHFESAMLEYLKDQLLLLPEYIEKRDQPAPIPLQTVEPSPPPAPAPTPKPLVEQPPKPPVVKPKIQMVIGWIDSHIQGLTDILVDKEIYLQDKQLPKRILLPEGQTTPVTIHSKEGLALEGTFVAQRNINKVRLYCKSKEAGWLYFGQPDEEIMVEIIKKKSNNGKSEHEGENSKKIEYQKQMKYLASEKAKVQTVSIVPSGSFVVNIGPNTIKYPVQNQIVAKNTKDEPISTKIIGKYGQGEITISLIEGTTKYPVNNPDGSLLCIVQLNISEYFGEPRTLPVGRKSLFVYVSRIDHILREQNRQRTYSLVLQVQQSALTGEFTFHSDSKSAMIDSTMQVPTTKEYTIKIISGSSKIAQFQFAVRFNIDLGVYRHEGYLRCGSWRLSLICFEVNYNDDFSIAKKGPQKMARLFRVFNADSLETISNEFKRSSKEFGTILQQRFKFTVSEINVLEGLLGSSNPRAIFNPLPTQKVQTYNSLLSVKQVHDELQLYDFEGEGFVKQEKAALVCSLIFKEPEINMNIGSFVPKLQQNYLADLRQGSNELVDYFQILRHIEMWRSEDRYFWGSDPNTSNDKKQDDEETFEDERKKSKLVGKTMKVSFMGFEDVVYRNMPGTYCFMLNDKKIAEPVPRCFTHKYAEPYPSVIVKLPCRLKVYNKEYGMVQLWKLVQICEVQLEEVSRVLNGKAYFKFQDTDLKLPQNEQTQKKQQIDPNKKPIIPPKPVQPPRNPSSPERVPFFPQVTPMKPQVPNTANKRLFDDTDKREQIDRFRKVMNQQIDLSKYNFEDSDDD